MCTMLSEHGVRATLDQTSAATPKVKSGMGARRALRITPTSKAEAPTITFRTCEASRSERHRRSATRGRGEQEDLGQSSPVAAAGIR